MTNIFRMMEPSAQYNLDRSVKILRALCWSLYANTVDVETLALIISKKEIFLAVANVFEMCINENLPLTTAAFENLLFCRDKDLKSVEEVIRTVEKLQFLLKEISESKIFTLYSLYMYIHSELSPEVFNVYNYTSIDFSADIMYRTPTHRKKIYNESLFYIYLQLFTVR